MRAARWLVVVVALLVGWSTPVAADGPPRALVVGDSVAATLALPAAVAAARPVARLTVQGWTCRRTTTPSPCNGATRSTLDELRRWRGQAGRALVVISGYNDAGDTAADFGRRIDAVMTEATRHHRGLPVVWLTLANRTGRYGAHNQALAAAARRWPALHVADWAGHAGRRAEWFVDGVHLTTAGAQALGAFVAASLTAVWEGRHLVPTVATVGPGSSVSPAVLPGTTLAMGARGPQVRSVQSFLARRGLRPGPVDGYYGPQTAAAVRRLQEQARRQGLLPRYAPGTWDRPTRDAAMKLR